MTTPYSAHEHRHNFAVWAAARATQRGFTTTDNLRKALESTGINDFLETPCGEEAFDKWHRRWCNSICDHLATNNIDDATYGRAAKLVAVYLKSMVVLPNLASDEAAYVHPPVDRILLQNIAKDPGVSAEHSQTLRNTSWTQLDEQSYFDVLSILREVNGDRPFWKLEEYWDVTPDSS
jgi:hypothetical protein